MPPNAKRRTAKISLATLCTKQPDTGKRYAAMTLGGVSLYAPDADFLAAAVDRIQTAIEDVLADHLLLIRNQLEKSTRELLKEELTDRVLGAVLGRSLRLGAASMLPCLTVNGRVLRMFFHRKNKPQIDEKLRALDDILQQNTAISVDAGQLACFPQRGWGTKFLAKQLLAHLAHRGRAVYVDDDLFTTPLPLIKDALGHNHK